MAALGSVVLFLVPFLITSTRCSNASFVSGPGQIGPTLTTPATVCRTAISQQTIPAIEAPIIMVRSSDLPRLSRRVMQSVVISCRSWGLPWYGDCPKPRRGWCHLLADGRVPEAALCSLDDRGERLDQPGTSMARHEKPASTRPGMIGDQNECAPPRPWMK